MKRRHFLKNTLATSAAVTLPMGSYANTMISHDGIHSKMKLSYQPYDLQLKHVFTLSNSSRTTTPVMLTKIAYDGYTGFGEASMPPYLGETQKTAADFLSKVKLEQFSSPFLLEDILGYIDQIEPGNKAAKASLDIALHDLLGKMMNQPWHRIWGLNPAKTPVTSFTIGIDTAEVVRQKVKEAAPYKILKVKLGRNNDKEMINTIREATSVPLCVDVNQGWKNREAALEMIYWLQEKGIVFVEQPLEVERIDDLVWLREHSPLPIFGDEAVQRLEDIEKLTGVYDGINIKLMKCTGLREAHKMANLAIAKGIKVMLGCMTETSCAISAAAQLSPLAEFADLDGNLLISNDPYQGATVIDGKITLSNLPGIGIQILKQVV